MNKRRVVSIAAVIGVAMLGVPLLTAAPAGATVSVASHHRLGVAYASRKVAHRPAVNLAKLEAAALRSAPIGAASVTGPAPIRAASLTGPAPACYGDSRPMIPVGGTLDPSSFGAFYNCSRQTWTFEVGTADTFSPAKFGFWAVGMDTDGNFNDNCGGNEYEAAVLQNNPGQYLGVVGALDSACNLTQTGTATLTLTPNGVAMTLPWAAIGDNPTLAWNALLQNRSEELANSGGDNVPSPSFVDAVVQGAVLDSIPPASPPNCSAGTAGTSEQVASTPDSHRAAAVLRGAGFGSVHDYGEGLVSFSGDASAADRTLARAGLSARVSLDHIFRTESVAMSDAGTTTAPNDPLYSTQWNLPAINAPGAWAVTTGNNVVVADIDTGVDFTHSDLPSPQLVSGIDETTTTPTPINAASGNTDSEGHGTAVAGVIAAATNNGAGLASLGWNTSVMPVKASTDGSFTTAAIAAGIMWAADNGARVINLSLGGPCPDSTLQSAISYAQGKGVLIVAAAGNGAINPGFDPYDSDYDYPSYPAAYPGVIAVGATGMDGYRAAYSNTGSYVSMMAPGGGVNNSSDFVPVLQSGGGYTAEAGTSFAAPQVAAAAALILSVNPHLTAPQVAELLKSTTTDLGPSGNDIEYGTGMLNASVAVADTPPTTPGYGTFFSLPPARILDTRIGLGAPHAKIGPGRSMNLTVAGAGGVPTTGVAAVVLNVTVTNTTAASFLTVWPSGQTRPNSSNVNFLANQTRPNLVTVKVGTGGQVSLFNAFGSTDVVADVAGYYGDGSALGGSTFMAVSPTRMLDTRSNGGPVAGGTSRSLQVTGRFGVPAGATGVVVNVTVTGPTAASFLSVYPAGHGVPNSSNLNFTTNQTVPNLVTVKLGSTGGIGFYNAFGRVQVIADLEGYFTAADDTTGSRFFPLVNHRILDTRANMGGHYGPIGTHQSLPVAIIGQGGVIDGGAAVVMNTTITNPTSPSFLTVYPAGQSVPNSSNLNFTANQTIANLVTAKVGTGGDVELYNPFGSVNAIVDVVGWYGPAGS